MQMMKDLVNNRLLAMVLSWKWHTLELNNETSNFGWVARSKSFKARLRLYIPSAKDTKHPNQGAKSLMGENPIKGERRLVDLTFCLLEQSLLVYVYVGFRQEHNFLSLPCDVILYRFYIDNSPFTHVYNCFAVVHF